MYIVLVKNHMKCYGPFKTLEEANKFATGFKDASAIPLSNPPGAQSAGLNLTHHKYI